MAKVFNYTILLVGLLLLFYLSGIPTASHQLIDVLFGSDLKGNPITSTFAQLIGSLFVAAAAAGITASFFGRQSNESSIFAVIIGTTLLFWTTADFMSIPVLLGETAPVWVKSVLYLIFFPLIAGYYIAMVQFWRGNDI